MGNAYDMEGIESKKQAAVAVVVVVIRTGEALQARRHPAAGHGPRLARALIAQGPSIPRATAALAGAERPYRRGRAQLP